ncbi:MAG: hypothetical protein ABIR37_03635 [Candidatus Saccharimonadales bacterium]
MFGHDDTTNQDDTTSVVPTEEQQLTALPPAPIAPSSVTPSVAPDFIATDANGHPDESASAPSLPGHASDLLDIKQDALKQLSPLVGHLNQTPEEKFRTTMMMIQASDDQSLINQAYDAAKEITDEKTRAQALLDIINEINYFTQQHEA